jgi:serine/threonine-protein kinase Chk2
MTLIKPSVGDLDQESKKARHNKKSQAGAAAPASGTARQPSPMALSDSMTTEYVNEGTVSPPDGGQGPASHPVLSPFHAESVTSPPSDTQQASQFIYPPQGISREVEDEEAEGVWGYLTPIASSQYEPSVVLKKRDSCAVVLPKMTSRQTRSATKGKGKDSANGKQNEPGRQKGSPSNGYIIGRHPECGKSIVGHLLQPVMRQKANVLVVQTSWFRMIQQFLIGTHSCLWNNLMAALSLLLRIFLAMVLL